MKYKVWDCKIVILDTELPQGFDYPPRRAAMNAVQNAGFKILTCFSGWGGELTDVERQIIEEDNKV